MTGGIDTLGKAAYRHMAVRATCRACAKAAHFMAHDLAGMYGNHLPVQSLKFRCRDCNKAEVEITLVEIDYDRRPKGIVWVPKRMG
jgi:hypothetical protein